jgi:hypothetical protein
LETLPPSPNTALLPAQEAKDRLREIVEGFFFWQLKGGADPRIELTAVSGVAAEDIQVREDPEEARTSRQGQ